MEDQAHLGCNEVWGGNSAANASLTLPGVRGWVYSDPYLDADAGGDVYYVSSCGTGRITRVMLADVMGHGAQAAEVGRYLRGLMRRYLNHIEPHTLARQVNELFNARSDDAGRFATAVILTFFAPTGEVTLCNAGHPAPLMRHGRDGRWAAMHRAAGNAEPSNLPLGVIESGDYTAFDATLDPDDAILLYTDGLIEATDPSGTQLGVQRLIDLLNHMDGPGPAPQPGHIAHALPETLEAQGYTLSGDDLSLVLLHCTERSTGAGFRRTLGGMKAALTDLVRGREIAWPEPSVRNIGGALFKPLNHVGQSRQDREG